MNPLPRINLVDYQYPLPEDRIAKYPLATRDQARLLVFKNGSLVHSKFRQLADFLPVNTTLFFNDTKVIPARMLFEKPTGGVIEVFLLNPADETPLGEALTKPPPVTWKCSIGNAKRWSANLQLTKIEKDITLHAAWNDRSANLVTFTWTPAHLSFADVIKSMGAVPLPPYLKRPAEHTDRERYQTIYSKYDGAVAAPTAGLHFTDDVLNSLKKLGIEFEHLTLHVSAGTFLPIKTENAAEHIMHEEEIVLHKSNIIKLLDSTHQMIAVGTTAMRTLESIYWYGVKLSLDPEAEFTINQEFPYSQAGRQLTRSEAMELVLRKMDKLGVESLTGHTSIYIMPGYRFKSTDGLLTNFHQPASSLLVLVSAFVGDSWKSIYGEALKRDYRFLSYGDSSLLFPLNN